MPDAGAPKNPLGFEHHHLVVPEINGWRGLAILAVVFHHQFSEPLTKIFDGRFGFLYRSGWLGVDIFFILSGFVLFLPYAEGRRRFSGRKDWLTFYKRRALRLLPAYYLIVIVEMIFSGRQPFDTAAHGIETVALLTLTFPVVPGLFSPPVNWALWSIGTELIFSAAFPLICIAVMRYGAFRILMLSLPICIGLRFFGHAYAPNSLTLFGEGLGRMDEFLWGILIASLYSNCALTGRSTTSLIIAALMLLAVPIVAEGIDGGTLPHFLGAFLITLFDCSAFIFVTASLCVKSCIASVLRFRPLMVIGMACYSIYLWHLPLLAQLRLHIDPWNIPTLLTGFICLAILSAITYRFIEFRSTDDWRKLFLLTPQDRSRSFEH